MRDDWETDLSHPGEQVQFVNPTLPRLILFGHMILLRNLLLCLWVGKFRFSPPCPGVKKIERVKVALSL